MVVETRVKQQQMYRSKGTTRLPTSIVAGAFILRASSSCACYCWLVLLLATMNGGRPVSGQSHRFQCPFGGGTVPKTEAHK
jgi:hypothetical protein